MGFRVFLALGVAASIGLGSLAAEAAKPRKKPPMAADDRYAALVVDAETGEVLLARDAELPRHPASLTKIMTAYMTFDALERGRLRLSDRLPVSVHAANQSPTKLGLQAGERIAVEDAILGVIAKSANDAAVVLAEALAGSEEAFAEAMTQRARRLGMRQSDFRNASGLPHPEQFSSARDMAILGRALIRDFPQYYGYFGRASFAYAERVYRNHNVLLELYDGTDGIKTGFTNASGYNLVASAVRDGRRLIGVVFGGESASWRNQHMMALLDRGFGKMSDAEVQVASASARTKAAKGSVVAAAQAQPVRPAEPRAVQRAAPAPQGSIETSFAVQVGAYRRIETAETRAIEAARLVPRLLAAAPVAIKSSQDSKGPLYRAQIAGLSKADARRACDRLKERQITCVVVPVEH
ncbi:MAG: D-alanyl-D-alanine carboxypeptidase [Alphaproteobacteria bacterium]|nr:D-alanyl-D-alanine carboxypeptidase [Alphaproteobacteria bacterium]